MNNFESVSCFLLLSRKEIRSLKVASWWQILPWGQLQLWFPSFLLVLDQSEEKKREHELRGGIWQA